MIWKILLEVFPFLWECFFGKKMTKEEPPSTNGNGNSKEGDKDKEEKASVKGFKAFINAFNKSKRLAASIIFMLLISLLLNYHLVNRVIAITRDESNKEVVAAPVTPPATRPLDEQDYYNHLVNHLRSTYE